MKALNIIICGVGGQGNILLEQLLGQATMDEGYEVRGADTFGAAQRGGSVLTHLRIGTDLNAVLVAENNAQIVVGLEPAEALTAAGNYLEAGGLIVVNTAPVLPNPVKTGQAEYPPFEAILNLMKKITNRIIAFDATALARSHGTERSLNVVMLGALAGSGVLPLSADSLKAAIRKVMAPKLVEPNLKAFEAGFAEGEKQAKAVSA